MKKKEIINIIIIAVALTALLGGCLYLANRHRFDDDRTFVPNIIGISPQTIDRYLYFDKNGTLMRYDSMTDSVTKLCGHSGHDENCILEKVGNSVRLYNNQLYFDYLTDFLGDKNSIAYYDIKSGKIHKTNIEISKTNEFFVSDGYIYYTDSGSICRIPAEGGKSEKLTECDYLENVFMVADGRIYTDSLELSFSSSFPTIYPAYIYSYDLETLEKEAVFEFTTTATDPLAKALYFDGKIYLQLRELFVNYSSSMINIFRGHLYRIDTKTHETIKLSDTNIIDFFLTENEIYYIPYEERQVYAPDVYQTDENGMYDVLRSKNIHACDLDGKNDSIIFTDTDISFEHGYIVNGKLFGLFVGSVPEIETNSFYASINIKTGEIKEVKIPN